MGKLREVLRLLQKSLVRITFHISFAKLCNFLTPPNTLKHDMHYITILQSYPLSDEILPTNVNDNLQRCDSMRHIMKPDNVASFIATITFLVVNFTMI